MSAVFISSLSLSGDPAERKTMAQETETIDSRNELRPVPDVIKSVTGKYRSASTQYRWREVGVNGVRLECVPAGNTWLTTVAKFSEFCQRQAEARKELAARAS